MFFNIIYGLLFLIMTITIISFSFAFLKENRCPVCEVYKKGVIYRYTEKNLLETDLIELKKIYVARKEFDLGKDEKIPVCNTCSFEIERILKEKNLFDFPSEVKLFFENEEISKVLSFQIKKTDFKPLIFSTFLLFSYLGIMIYKDYNSWFTIIGVEGLIMYMVSLIIYGQVYWEGYLGKKGIIMFQRYGPYRLFLSEFDWMRVKYYSTKKNGMRLHFNEMGVVQILFYLVFKMPKTEDGRGRLFTFLNKNKVPIKN